MFVKFASSRAASKPKTVTKRALSFNVKGIVIVGVFIGSKLDTTIKPAMMLPQPRRLIGFNTMGLFSLIEGRGRNRGWPIRVKKVIRRLYVAVKEVATRVRIRAQELR